MSRVITAAVLLGSLMLAGCSPEGACTFTRTDGTEVCADEDEKWCDGGTFSEGEACSDLGYTQSCDVEEEVNGTTFYTFYVQEGTECDISEDTGQ